MEKTRNLGIDILCCLAGIMLLGLCLFDQIGLEQITITGYSGALPIAVRWFCMSGAMLLAACAGYVLSVRKYAASHFKTVGRLLYIYLVGTAIVFAARRFLIGEEMTALQMLQELLGFSASSTSHITGMYFLLMLAAPFLNTAFQGLKSRSARMTFVVIPAVFGTLQPILQFGEITVIPQWCIGLAPIAAYLGGAFIRRYGKHRDIVILTVFALLAFAAQVIAALMTSLRTGFIDCPWLESMAALPSLLMALCLVGLFHSRHEGSGTAHRFFGGASGGILMGVMIAEPLMRCLMLNIVDSFPIISTRLVAGIVVVPLVFIMCTALSLMLQFPILLRRQANSSNAVVYEEDKPKPRAKKRPKHVPAAPVTEAPQTPEVFEEEPEIEAEPEDEDEPEAETAPEIEAETEDEDEPEIEAEEEEEPEAEAEPEDEDEPEAEAEPEDEDEAEDEAEPEIVEEPEDEAEDTGFEITDEDDEYEAEEADESEKYEEEAVSEEEYEEEPEAPAVSISLPHRTSQPLPHASENSSRHTITVPVSQPETQIRLTQPPPEPPIGVREATRPAIAPLRPTFKKPQPVQPQPEYTQPKPAQPQPTYTQPAYTQSQPAYVPPVQQRTPEPEPPEYQTRSYTLDEILTEQGIPVKHMPETVDDLIKELTK